MSEMHDIYESCQTFQKSKQLDVLDHLLEINFIHVPTKKVLKRVRFYVSADEALADAEYCAACDSDSVAAAVEAVALTTSSCTC